MIPIRKILLTIGCGFVIASFTGQAIAGPWLAPGNSSLRSDIQLLADGGRILSPVMTWPLSWGDIAESLDTGGADWSPAEMAALARVQSQLNIAADTNTGALNGHVSGASNPLQIRSFEDVPREKGEIGIGYSYTGNWWAVSLQGQRVSRPRDRNEWRADNSYIGVALGNWMLAASTLDRWWGPGWQGSLIMSNSARPIPAITLGRNSTAPFESKWLSWLGHWDLEFMYGLLENDRAIPDAQFVGLRLDFRPLRSFEFGISRTAIYCGQGQRCGLSAFTDVLFRGDDETINPNQLGGFDWRWSNKVFGVPFALYGSMIGEDENNFLPTDYLGQLGGETWGYAESLGTWRAILEWSDTECDFRFYRSIRSDSGPGSSGCAYNDSPYATGYRYQGRPIGHSFDGDASVFTLTGVLTAADDSYWMATMAAGNLNRRNNNPTQFSPNKIRYRDLELVHRRPFWMGWLRFGLGYDRRSNIVTGINDSDVRAFAEFGLDY